MSRILKLENWFFGKRFWLKVPFVIFFVIVARLLIPIFLEDHPIWVFYLSFFMLDFLGVYLLLFMAFIIRHSLKNLFSASNMWTVFLSYIIFIFCVLLLFSSGYRYMECSSQFSPSMIGSDSLKSEDFFYFSAITFFTVGYGDVCPIGWNKQVAIFNAFVGVFINTILMVVVISAYLKRKEMSKGVKNE